MSRNWDIVVFFQMPAIGSTEFYAGAIRVCIEDAKFIERELASEQPKSHELLQLLDRKAQANHELFERHIAMVPDEVHKELRRDYRNVWKGVLKRMIIHYKKTGSLIRRAREPVVPEPNATEEPDQTVAELVAQAEAITEADGAMSLAAMKATANPNDQPDADYLEMYASDNDEQMPAVRMSLVTCPAGYQPLNLLEQQRESPRQNPFARRASEQQKVAGSSQATRVVIPPGDRASGSNEGHQYENSRTENRRIRNPTSGGGHQLSALAPAFYPSGRHVQTVGSTVGGTPRPRLRRPYEWAKQVRANGPITGVPYPPMGHQRPIHPELRRNDPAIVGMAEIWTQRVGMRDPVKCAKCQFQGKHRMYECPGLQRESIQSRWYQALKLGVCLNCMIIGHSSFTCTNQGCCPDHGTRHSSFLCELSFNNQLWAMS